MIKKTVLIALVLFPFYAFSQIPAGTWRDHFSYRGVTKVVEAGDIIYAASENAVFSYDKTEKTMEKLNRVNGFSDSEVQLIAYNKANDALIIVYKNSNIDVLKNNTIYNLSEIKRKLISTDKTIYSVVFSGNTAYLSCGFGIVLLDTDKLEFTDTYLIGDESSYLKVYDVAFDDTNIYAASELGLFYADKNSPNLYDYRSWTLSSEMPKNSYPCNLIEYMEPYLFVNQVNPEAETDTLYIRENNVWREFETGIENLLVMNAKKDKIVFSSAFDLKIYNSDLSFDREPFLYQFPDTIIWPHIFDAYLNDDNNLVIADKRVGLVFEYEDNVFDYKYPNGPYNNYTAKALYSNGKIITTDGNNRASGWYEPTWNVFENEEWKSYHITRDTAFNFFSIAVNPNNPDNMFIGSWGYGVFEFQDNKWMHAYNHTNSSLQYINDYSYGYIRIEGMAFDKNNNLWISNHNAPEPVSVKTTDNRWQSFNFNGLIPNYLSFDIYVSSNNFKWVELGKGDGLLVFDDNGTPLQKGDDRFKIINPTTNGGEIISSTITALSEDKTGNIWLGTDDGIVVYYDADNAFENDFFADRIQLTSYGTDTSQQYLLQTEIINDIETDGANRKWIATQSSGAFLMSENGKEEIAHFTKYNSPLISNAIKDIVINPESGEVFFLTEKGIVSYRADATEAGEEFENVYVFPNPVRPDYDGIITITGLAANVNVKIADIAGNLVYETDALGGQAVWDGKTFDGRKANTGVYLVYCSNKDGSQTFITKLLFLH